MRKSRILCLKIGILLVAILCLALLANCCPMEKVKPVVEQPPPTPTPPNPTTPTPTTEPPEVKEIVLEPIYFDYNKFDLRPGDQEILNRNIQKLKEDPQAKIRVEGNCDERGTVEYNLALGEKRAGVARDYLVKMGVPEDRIQTLSYGKEKSKPCTNEECWSKDRRDDFVIISK
jgi:peptidoglycan-associated lipoprotein